MIAAGEPAPDFTLPADADGTVAHVLPKVSPKTHDERVLALLAAQLSPGRASGGA